MVASRRAYLVVLAATLLGCTGSAPSASPDASATAIPSGQAVTRACGPIALRTPAGERLDLTGTWSGDDALFLIAQEGDCVAWEELSNDSEPGSRFRRVYSGRLSTDFSVDGTFVVIYVVPGLVAPGAGFVFPRSGDAEYRIIVEQVGGDEVITLEGPSRESTDFGVFETVVLTRISTSTALPESQPAPPAP